MVLYRVEAPTFGMGTTPHTLTAGTHTITVEFYEHNGGALATADWAPA